MNQKKDIYVLVPLAYIEQTMNLNNDISDLLKMNESNYTVYELNQDQLAVKIHEFKVGFLEIDEIMQQCHDLQNKVKYYQEILINYNPEEHVSKSEIIDSNNIEALVRKAKKAKQLKEQNKKLKKLLQLQLQNTEKVREETQKTMRTLKQEFDALVEEMNIRESKENNRQGGGWKKKTDEQWGSNKVDKAQQIGHHHPHKQRHHIKRELHF